MGQSTLHSNISRADQEKPIVFVDSREASTKNGKKIIQEMRLLSTDVIVRKLDFGDYIVGEDVAVERKTVSDFANTLAHRFLFEQIFRMKEVYPKALLIIEGYMGVLRKFRRVSPESLHGALFSLAQNGIPLVPTIDYKDTALFLVMASRQLIRGKKSSLSIRRRIKTESTSEQQLFLLSGLPHVGPVLADSLLKYFGTPRRAFCASKEELISVKDVGSKIAQDIVNILETPYIPLTQKN